MQSCITDKVGRPSIGVSEQKKEMIIRSFKKCGLSVAIDGSEDDQISIEKLPR